MLIGVPRETAAGETRVAATPETVKAAFTKENDVFAEHNVKYVDPVLNFADRKLFELAVDAGLHLDASFERSPPFGLERECDLDRIDRLGLFSRQRQHAHQNRDDGHLVVAVLVDHCQLLLRSYFHSSFASTLRHRIC